MPKPTTTASGYQRAHELRGELTPAETRLWAYLRRKAVQGAAFRRQHAIGPYIVDFCCIKRMLVVELDGSQHLDQAEYDRERTAFLEGEGYRVLRFWNQDVERDMNGVIAAIESALERW
jgi:very-short-patch-repair endonuclease